MPAGGAGHVCHAQRRAVVQAIMANSGEDTATVTALNERLGRQCSAMPGKWSGRWNSSVRPACRGAGGGQPGLEPGGGSLSQYGGLYGEETV